MITVGLPLYNARATVLDSIRSVFTQTETDWRLVIVDDGSTDGVLHDLRRIDDDRVEVRADGKNRGLAARLNEIAARCETPLLARLDADDLMHPGRLAAQAAAFSTQPSADLIASYAVSIDRDSQPHGLLVSPDEPTDFAHFPSSPLIHPTVTARADWFRAHPYDPAYRRSEDQELWIRTLRDRETIVLHEALLYYREVGAVSSAKYRASLAATCRVIRQHAPAVLGVVPMYELLAIARAKQAVFTAAEALHLSDRIVSHRSRRLTPAQFEEHADTVARIRTTPIPGLDG